MYEYPEFQHAITGFIDTVCVQVIIDVEHHYDVLHEFFVSSISDMHVYE